MKKNEHYFSTDGHRSSTSLDRQDMINFDHVTSLGTRGSYVRRSGGALASHVAHDSQRPMALDLPSAVKTHGLLLQGG
jgi:hypothetical protein